VTPNHTRAHRINADKSMIPASACSVCMRERVNTEVCVCICNEKDRRILVSKENRHVIRPVGTGKSLLVLLTK